MDRNSPDHYRETTEESIAQTEKFVEEIIKRPSFKKGLVVPVITPRFPSAFIFFWLTKFRFVPTCTPQLLRFLGEIAWKYHLPIQSHISENKDEVNKTPIHQKLTIPRLPG
jgi:guanine deaminase